MATAKKASVAKKAGTKKANVGSAIKSIEGKAPAGKEWNPAVDLSAKAAAIEEVMAPRPPTTSRYPITNAAFEALKAAAPQAKLAKKSAIASKDSKTKDEVAQRGLGPLAMAPGLQPSLTPTASTNFAGITATGWLPPDCTLAAGPQHLLISVNSSLAVHSKSGGPAIFQRTLTQWFANIVSGMTIFDPKAIYDQHAGRWVVLAVATRTGTQDSLFLLSISVSSDPGGSWRNYKLDATLDGNKKTSNWADFPALGVDSNALYLTANMFAFGGGFQYVKARVIPKTGPYSGGTAPYFDFTRLKNADNTLVFTLQPCHTFGAPQVEYLVNSAFPSGNYLSVWRILNATSSPTITRSEVKVSPYSLAPNAEQKGGNPLLNTGDVRILHAVFRGDSIWTAFTAAHTWGAGPNRAAVQWSQIRAASPALVQEGIFGAAAFHYFYPAPCPDNNGNMMMVMSRSGPTEFGSILYTGRRSTDALGTLQASTMLKAGAAHYQGLDSGGRNRWGDYNGAAADPANARAIWFYSTYASAPNVWATWVGSAFF